MASIQKNSLEEFEAFFGGDVKGPQMIQAMYQGTDYQNENGSPQTSLATELLRSANFNNFQNNRSVITGQTQGPEDVNQGVTDLIITTALFHRSIDKSTTVGTNLGAIINRISNALDDFLDVKLTSSIKMSDKLYATTAPSRHQSMQSVYEIATVGDMILYTLADRAAWDAHEHPHSNVLSNAMDDRTGTHYIGMISELFDCRDNKLCLRDVFTGNYSDKGKKIPNAHDALIRLYGTDTNEYNNFVANIGFAIANALYKLTRQMKNNILTQYPMINNDERTNNILTMFSSATVKAFVTQNKNKYLTELKHIIKSEVKNAIRDTQNNLSPTRYTTLNDKPALDFVNTIYNNWANLGTEARKFYTQNVTVFVKTSTGKHIDPNEPRPNPTFQNLDFGWTRLTNNEINKLFSAGKPFTADSDIRVNLMKNRATGEVLFQSNLPNIENGVTVWYTQMNGALGTIAGVPPDFLKRLYGAVYLDGIDASQRIINVDLTSMMIGGAEEGEGSAEPAETEEKEGTFRTSRLSGTSGTSGTSGASGPSTVYGTYGASLPHTYGTGNTIILINIDPILSDRLAKAKPFNLNFGRFLSAVSKREEALHAQQYQQPQQSSSDMSLDVYPFLTAIDMAYGQVWTYDQNLGQYYRTENGKKIWYNDYAKGDAKTCYATYLSKGNDKGCRRVIQCIEDGNSETLNRCLDVLEDVNLWDVAADDAIKVGPDMVRLVLNKFGVTGIKSQDSNGDDYVVPISYEEWMRDVVSEFPEDVKTSIKKNSRLLTYIKGLLSVCRSNLSILNKNNPTIVAKENIPTYMRDLKMNKYKIPSSSRKSQFEFFSESLKNSLSPGVVNNDLWNPIISGNMTNVGFFSPYNMNVPSMMGGNFYEAINPTLPTRGASNAAFNRQTGLLRNGSANIFETLSATIVSSLADVGLKIHPEDANRIGEAIRRMKKDEERLVKMFIVLNNIVILARFYGVTLENVDKEHLTNVKRLVEINSLDDIKNFIRCHVRDITKNMATNMSLQQATSYELMSKLMPRFLDDCVGKGNSLSKECDTILSTSNERVRL